MHFPESKALLVKPTDRQTIEALAQRSDKSVLRVTQAFAICGALMDIGAHTISGIMTNSGGISMLWGMWIPLCFLTIPPIHYLCRRVVSLEQRLEALTLQLEKRPAA